MATTTYPTGERIDYAAILDGRTKALILAGVLLCLFLAALDQTIVGTALPAIVRDLNGLDLVAWISTGYLLASTATVPIYGKLSDLYGRRAILIWGVIVFLAGSALCGIATNMLELIAFRIFQGIGAAALTSTAFAVPADLFAPEEPDHREDGGQDRGAHELRIRYPEDLPGQQVLEVVAAVRVVREQKYLHRRRKHEQDADQRLLRLGPLLLGPGEEQGAGHVEPRRHAEDGTGPLGFGQVVLVKRGDVDVGAGRFVQRPRPLRPQSGNAPLHLRAPFPLYDRAVSGETRHVLFEQIAVFLARDIERAARAERAELAQHRTRSEAERRYLGAAVAFVEERRRAAGGVIAGRVFGLDN